MIMVDLTDHNLFVIYSMYV